MVHRKKLNKKYILIAVFVFIGCVLFYKLSKFNKEKIHILKDINSSGQLIGTNEYIIKGGDTVMQGKFINYNEKGDKISEGQFLNGNINGICTYYYDNGKVEEVHFRKNKDITLESVWNYPNGKIEKYAMYSEFGAPIFMIEYDEKDKVDNYKGNPQLEIKQHNLENHENKQINNYFKVGDTLKYSYLIANIPNVKRSFTIENLSVNNSKVKRITKKVAPCQLDVEEVLTKKGKNTIKSIVRYEFNDKVTPVFTDTLSFDVNVH
jgi:hypothetical protein